MWFPTITEEEILAVSKAAVTSNTKKTTQLSLAASERLGLLFQ